MKPRMFCEVCFRDEEEGASDIKFVKKFEERQCLECRHIIGETVFRREQGLSDPLTWPQVLSPRQEDVRDEDDYN